ncbi:NYN domain-containing protein [Achromobacter pestifer]
MNTPTENVSMALFCDFENVALGVRDTKYQKFDIRPVLERLLLKGSIVVKKAYCDWERYKEFKAPMHEANFELIEIPHVRQSGKNSADIRLVVDALDFCYTKSHVNTFVIISGDSDFSPLVSKLRENNKKVIGVGVKQSTSDLLIANCDEFIFYDDLAREGQRTADARRDNRGGASTGQRRTPDEERRRKEELDARKTQAVEMVAETFEALMAERGDSGKVWASALKDALKRRRPDFNESYYGFRAFGNLLEEAQSRGFLEVGREENAGTYVYRDSTSGVPAVTSGAGNSGGNNGGNNGSRSASSRQPAVAESTDAQAGAAQEESSSRSSRKSRGGRKSSGSGRGSAPRAEQAASEETASAAPVTPSETVSDVPSVAAAVAPAVAPSEAPRATPAAKQPDGPSQEEKQAEAAKIATMQADALARAQESKPVQASRLPPMPKPFQPTRQATVVAGPPPTVNIAEWTFAEPAPDARRESASKTPAKVSDPFAGGSPSPAVEAPAVPVTKRAPARSRTAAKTATPKAGDTGKTSHAAAKTASAPQAGAAVDTTAKPATKSATKSATKPATKAASKTATGARRPRKTAASET